MDDDDSPTGRAKGGKARMDKLTKEERSLQAKQAAATRWSNDVKKATHGSDDHPLKIGDAEIGCYVLEDGTRVLSQRGVVGALGMRYGSRAGGADRLTSFLSGKGLSPYVSNDLLALIGKPIRFTHPGGGGQAFGYPATILTDICDVVLAARKANALQKQQMHIADQAELLVRGFARVGIIALVDEATGYQRDREKDALAKILEAWVAKELQAWVKTFPREYYENMFRLRGLPFNQESVKRPQYFGHLTNDVVYKRLEPGVLKELKRVTPRSKSGRHVATFTQSLTKNIGYPKLKEHLGAVVAFMKISKSWGGFMNLLDEHYPRQGDTPMLPMDYEQREDDGKGL